MKTLAAFLAIVFLSASARAASIKFAEGALKDSPENLGIDLGAVPSYEVAPYKFDRTREETRAREVISRNPAAQAAKGRAITSRETDEEIVFSAGSLEYSVSKTTGAEALLDLARYAVGEKGEQALAESQLRQIAERYVREHITGVGPDELRFLSVKRIMNAVGKLDPQSKQVSEVSTSVANYIVVYQRQIGKIPVLGSGENIRLYLSPNGEIIGHSKVWRDLRKDPVSVKPAIGTDQIRRIFTERHQPDPVQQIVVDQVRFGYLAYGRYSRQETLKPVYWVGFTYGPSSKRVIELYDAYTGQFIRPPEEEPGDRRPVSPLRPRVPLRERLPRLP